jgi:ribosomal protein L37AE/L43A
MDFIMTINNLTSDEFDAFVDDYYNSSQSIKKILEKYNLDKMSTQKVIDILPDIKTKNKCEHCNTTMVYSQKSRTAYKENFQYSDEICPNCNHRNFKSSFGRKICDCDTCVEERKNVQETRDKLKLTLLKRHIEVKENAAINDIDEIKLLSLDYKTYLLTFLMYVYDEKDHSFKTIDSIDGIKFAPTKEYGFDVVSSLLRYPIINFKITQNTLDGITFDEEDFKSYTYTPYFSDYKLNLKYSDLFDFAEIVKSCEYIYSCDIDETKEEALSLWKEIAFQELKEYIYYLFEKYNFNTDLIKDAITEKLELIIEDFSISQGYAILYSSVNGAASYKQTGITHRHAVNSANSFIAKNIAKRKSGEWDSRGYKRNYDLPQTAISMTFFNNILKIGNKGFEEVACIENIPDDFIDELEEIDISPPPPINNKLTVKKELLEQLDLLTSQEYSFGEIFDLLNQEYNNLKEMDDSTILHKLKEINTIKL